LLRLIRFFQGALQTKFTQEKIKWQINIWGRLNGATVQRYNGTTAERRKNISGRGWNNRDLIAGF
jgi:hypothetical protein